MLDNSGDVIREKFQLFRLDSQTTRLETRPESAILKLDESLFSEL